MSIKNEIIDAAARAAFVSAWADYQEEQGESLHGELMDQAPKTPAAAKKWAKKLVSVMEKMNGKSIEQMYRSAASGSGKHYREATPEDFGHYTAMESMGHGVSWRDDHPAHGFLVPHTEFHCFGSRSCEGYVSDREGIAHRG